MRFQAYFTPIIKILLYVMAIISLAGVIVGILALTGIPIELSQGQATLLISVCPLCTVIALLFATVHYRVEKNFLRLYVGFIDIFGGRVRIDKILNVVIDDGHMYISYLYKDGIDPVISAIVINPKRYNEMKNALLSKNPNIIFYENKNESTDSKQ